jgi:hypothetical protein
LKLRSHFDGQKSLVARQTLEVVALQTKCGEVHEFPETVLQALEVAVERSELPELLKAFQALEAAVIQIERGELFELLKADQASKGTTAQAERRALVKLFKLCEVRNARGIKIPTQVEAG